MKIRSLVSSPALAALATVATWTLGAALLGGAAPAAAQDDWPAKPVRIVVPFAPGGSTDVVARVLAEKLGAEFKQQFIIDNKAGAAGNLGADAVAKSPADGYTLLMATTGVLSINAHLYKNMSYDAQKDLVPVSYTSLITNIFVVPSELPLKTVADVVAKGKSAPGTMSFASSGAGSSTHLSAELFKAMAGLDIVHVPYRGSAQALTDVISGRVTMLFDNAPSSLPFIQQGKLRALAVTGPKRLPSLPDVPTLDEAGIKGYESLSWSGIAAPAGTPPAVITKLNRAIDRILKTDDVRQKFAALGIDAVGGPPEAFARHIAAENDKWSRLIRSANIVLN